MIPNRLAQGVVLWLAALSSSVALGEGVTIEEVVDLAKKKSTPQKKIIRYQKEQADADVNIYRSQIMPRINFSVNRMRNMTPTSKLGTPLGDDHIYSTDTLAKIEMQGPLFSFGRLGAVYNMAKSRRKIVGKQAIHSEQQYLLSVVSAYSQALLDLHNSLAAKKSEVIAKRLLDFTTIEYRNGARSKIDMLRIKSQHLIKVADKERMQLLAESSRKKLMQLVDADEPFQLKPVLEEGRRDYLSEALNTKESKSLALGLKEEEVRLNELLLQYHKASHYPTLSYFGNIQSSISQSILNSDVEDGDLAEEKYRSGSLGVSFTWTIFGGLEDQNNIRKYASSYAASKIEFEEMKKEEKRVIEDMKSQAKVTLISVNAVQKSTEAIELAFKRAESDYKENAASLTDLLELEADLLTEKQRLYRAYKDLINTTANLRVMQGKRI